MLPKGIPKYQVRKRSVPGQIASPYPPSRCLDTGRVSARTEDIAASGSSPAPLQPSTLEEPMRVKNWILAVFAAASLILAAATLIAGMPFNG
jgi:hypothetical protein